MGILNWLITSKCINQGVPGGEDGEEAGGEQKQAGDSPVLPGVALFGLDCLWYARAHAHSHAAPLSLVCKPAAPELFLECQV